MTGELLVPELAGEVLSAKILSAPEEKPQASGFDLELATEMAIAEMGEAFQSAIAEPENRDAWAEFQARRDNFENHRRAFKQPGDFYDPEPPALYHAVEIGWQFHYGLSQCVQVVEERPQEAGYIWSDIIDVAERIEASINGSPDTYDDVDCAGRGVHVEAQLGFDSLLVKAEHVAGMPFETPLRWQEALGFIGGPAVSRYVMVRKPDDGTLTITRELGVADTDNPTAFHYRDSTPTPDESGYWWNTSVRFQSLPRGWGYSAEKALYTASPNASCRYLRQGGSPEINAVRDDVVEARANASARQAEFLAGLALSSE